MVTLPATPSTRMERLVVPGDRPTMELSSLIRITPGLDTLYWVSFRSDDTQYSVSDPGVIRINEDNSIVGLSAGTTTLTVRVDGVTSSVTIQVLGDPNQTDDAQPTEEDAQKDEQAPSQEELPQEEESSSEEQETTEEPTSQADEIEGEE